MGTLVDALASVDAFEADPDKATAWRLDRAATLARLRELLRNPDLMHQRGLNACGPAVFFRLWLARDPVAVARFACTLLYRGAAEIGTLAVRPRPTLLHQDHAQIRNTADAAAGHQVTPETADWMLLCALRDSENGLLEYRGEPDTFADRAAGVTLPSTLQGWLAASGAWYLVQNHTNLVFAADPQHLLQTVPAPTVDVVLLANSTAATGIATTPIVPGWAPPQPGLFPLPDHYIAMTGPFRQSTDQRWVHVDFWSWGERHAGWQGSELLMKDYFGQISGWVQPG